ncbi:hypothetical protein [Pseudomonas pseudonitroreducens]|uniref:hypothetical protein n=1 Tax=Pseudomonas pseudonitroreducens TaxID=2892326 RepID=UPI001F3E8D9E|nr:hypothetical protein [Pseudomonas pseudonitroreducens]
MSTLTAPLLLSPVQQRLRLLAVVLFSAIGPLVLLTAPALASRYIAELGLDNRQVGFLFSMELGPWRSPPSPPTSGCAATTGAGSPR